MTCPIDNEIRDLIGKGLTFAQIGNHLGITRNVVAGRCRRMGIRGAPKRLGGTAAVAEWFAEFDGTLTDCADELGLTLKTARQLWNMIVRDLGPQAG